MTSGISEQTPFGQALWAQNQFELYEDFLSARGIIRRRFRSRKELRREYKEKIGRTFEADFALYKRAQKFGALIGKWHKALDKREVAKFFVHLALNHLNI